MDKPVYAYRPRSACVQLGEKPPYNCVNIPARMNGDLYEVKIGDEWYTLSATNPHTRDYLPIKSVWGQPIAGISLDLEIDRERSKGISWHG